MKLYGAVVDVPQPGLRERYGDALEAAIDWRPPEPFHLFALNLVEAGAIGFGDEPRAMRWSEGDGLVVLRHPND